MAVLLLNLACEQPVLAALDMDGDRYTVEGGDCNDADGNVHPGAPEHCDGADEDCDGRVDEEVAELPAWYPDADGDGFGEGEPLYACVADPGWVQAAGDCDDEEPAINPAVIEVCENGLDDNCDGSSNGCMDEGEMYLDGYIGGGAVFANVGHKFGMASLPNGSKAVFLGGSDGVYLFEGDLHGAHTVDEATTTWTADESESLVDISVSALGADSQSYLIVGRYDLDSGTGDGGVYLVPLDAPSGAIGSVAQHLLEGETSTRATESTPLGDTEGDGRMRLGVGGDPREGMFGAAWVVSDAPGGVSSLADAEFILRGEGMDDNAGGALAGLGDVDGDGLSDLAVGAREAYVGDIQTGLVYVLLGPIGGRSTLADADVRLPGLDSGGHCGFPTDIEPIMDMDMDGLPEVAIGGDTCDYVLYYTAADVLNGEPSTVFYDGGGFGVSVADVGDSNGDGWRDLLVGAPDYSDYRGLAFLFRGPIAPGTYTSGSSDARLWGGDGDVLGQRVGGLGDLDDDGYTEFGVYSYSSERAVSLFYGGGI